MEAPSLVLVPPTPNSTANTPSPSSSNTPSTASSSPQSRFSGADQDRTSSETTIFSIYSMYGDEHANRASWSASGPTKNGDRKSRDAASIQVIPTVDLSLPESYNNSFFKTNGYASSDLAYYDPDVQKLPPSARVAEITKAMAAAKATSPVHGSVPVAHNYSRPLSCHATSSSLRVEPPADRRASSGHTHGTIDLAPPLLASEPSQASSYQTAQYSRRSSRSSQGPQHRQSDHSLRDRPSQGPQHRQSDNSLRNLPPLPPSQSPTPPRQPSPNLQPPKPSTPQSLPLKHPVYMGSPESNTSIVPSDGEDMDAFHVRNTYAQLEMSGVKGDGYEDGVERTRARVGSSRASQLNAAAALGDGQEKNQELDPKEIETLKALDRYGFFTVPSHDRLVLLTSGPLSKRLSTSTAGPSNASASARSLSALPTAPLPVKESSRIIKWTRMLQPATRDEGGNVQTWTVKPSKQSKLRSRAYKGIPDRWRGAAWELMMSRFARIGVRGLNVLGEEYRDALDKPSTYDIQIDLDVPRTISGHVMFRTRYGAGQRSLFHVLHCFSLRCESCGYVQGMGPIAATLLCYFEPERVYASLVRLHDAYSMHTVFNPGFPGLLEAIYVQERITEQMMPDVYAAFKKHMISTTSYATKWYITLFSNSVPFQTQLRLWDAFLLEGYDVFIAVAIAIVWVYRDQITSGAANFETVLSLLSSFFVPEDENTFLAWIEQTLGDKKLRTNMLRWRADWKELVASGKDGAALL